MFDTESHVPVDVQIIMHCDTLAFETSESHTDVGEHTYPGKTSCHTKEYLSRFWGKSSHSGVHIVKEISVVLDVLGYNISTSIFV